MLPADRKPAKPEMADLEKVAEPTDSKASRREYMRLLMQRKRAKAREEPK